MTRAWSIVAGLALIAGMSACASFAPRSRAAGPVSTERGVRFVYFAPTAHRVQLAGSWPGNNWAKGDGPVGEADIGLMADDDGDGVWEIVVELAPGRYQYLFWIDEATWRIDPGNPSEVDGGPAGRASEILVIDRGGRLELR